MLVNIACVGWYSAEERIVMNNRQKKKRKKRLEKIEKRSVVMEEKSVEGEKDTAQKEQAAEAVIEEKLSDDVKSSKVCLSVFNILYIPAAILFLEIVIMIAHGGSLFCMNGVYVTLFSAGYGLVLTSIVSFLKKHEHKVLACEGVLFAAGLLYTVIYFLFCEFQLFYDLNTMMAGAADAATHFSGDIISLVCSFDGVLHILLFFLPFIFYKLFHKRLYKNSIWRAKERILAVLAAIVCMGVSVILIGMNELDSDAYGSLYNYDSAVKGFGLLTGIRLEIKNSLSGGSEDESFDFYDYSSDAKNENAEDESVSGNVISANEADSLSQNEADSVSDNSVSENEAAGDNILDIDFEALAMEDSGTYSELDSYVASLDASNKNEYTGMFKGKNLIFMTAEAFTAEAIREDITPTLYRMANKGIQFTDYYQPASAGTTGGEYSNIFGMLPSLGGKSVKTTATHYNWNTIGSRLDAEGYYGKAYHNNDYTYYDRHKTHINLGYSDGYEGYGNGIEEAVTKQWPESDLEMLEGTFPLYADKQPFNIYYMTVSGHSLYGFGNNAMAKKHKDEVLELEYSEPVKAYLAAQIELDAALEYLINELEKRDMADDTVIVISADHFPYGLDQKSGGLKYLSELYGVPVDNNLIRDHNRLIIWSGCLEKEEPIVVSAPVSSIDVLPTLCNLFAVPYDSRLFPGRDVFSDSEAIIYTLGYEWKTELGSFYKGKFHPVDEEAEIPDDYVKRISSIVKNKIVYSKGVLQKDYFRHVFKPDAGDE